jgi:hypothetical protein
MRRRMMNRNRKLNLVSLHVQYESIAAPEGRESCTIKHFIPRTPFTESGRQKPTFILLDNTALDRCCWFCDSTILLQFFFRLKMQLRAALRALSQTPY